MWINSWLVLLFSWATVNPKNSWLTLSAGHILDSCPPVEDHGAVVVNMKESHLIVLLPQDEEDLPIGKSRDDRYTFNFVLFWHWNVFLTNTYRVAELYDLGEEKPPADSGHLEEASNGEFYILFNNSMFYLSDGTFSCLMGLTYWELWSKCSLWPSKRILVTKCIK